MIAILTTTGADKQTLWSHLYQAKCNNLDCSWKFNNLKTNSLQVIKFRVQFQLKYSCICVMIRKAQHHGQKKRSSRVNHVVNIQHYSVQSMYFLEYNWQPDKVLTFEVSALINILSLRYLFQAELKGRGFTPEYRHLWFALFPPPVLTTFGANVLLGDPP
jgi:hypothetical protein